MLKNLFSCSTANTPDTVKALCGELIKGVFCNGKGEWFLIVESGHAFVFNNNGAFRVERPEAVRDHVRNRRAAIVEVERNLHEITQLEDVLLKT